MIKVGVLVLITGLMLLGGCASQQAANEQAQQYEDPKDPLESLNRTMWDFNYEILERIYFTTYRCGLRGLYATNCSHRFTELGRES